MHRLLTCALMATGSLAVGCAARSGTAATGEPQVILRPKGRPEVRVRVELARTPAARERGLMYRENLAEADGMLFLFDREDELKFWMKNTYISLDMIFITKDRRVLGSIENAEPLSPELRYVPGKSQFVLEVVGGFTVKHGIVPGTPVELINAH